MKNRVTWNVYSAVLLLDTYLAIKEDGRKRNQLILALSKFLRGQIDWRKEIASDAYAGTADINQKLGKLEYLMTNGETGLPGAALPCMEQAVDWYKNDYNCYLSYKEAARKMMPSECPMVLSENLLKTNIAMEGEPYLTMENLFMSEGNLFAPEENRAAIENKAAETSSPCEERPADDKKIESNDKEMEEKTEQSELVTEESFFSPDASLRKLSFSTRLENVLFRNRIFTIEDMLDVPEEAWMNLHGMGVKSFHELLPVYRKYKRVFLENASVAREATCENSDGNEQSESMAWRQELVIDGSVLSRKASVTVLPVSNRIKNVFFQHGLRTVGDALEYPEEHLCQLRGMGKRALAEWKRFLELHQKSIFVANANGDNPHGPETEERKALVAFMELLSLDHECIRRFLGEKQGEERGMAEKFWEEDAVREAVRNWILARLETKKYDGVSRSDFIQEFPKSVYSAPYFLSLLETLEEEGEIRQRNDMIFRVYPSFTKYLASVDKEKTGNVIALRLQGETLEEVAQKMGVTRERVRQIQKKFFDKMPLMEEGYWISVQKTYGDLTEEDFGAVFQISSSILMLLSLWGCVFPHGRNADDEKRLQNLQRIAQDSEMDESTRRRAWARMQEVSPHFYIDGKRIPKKRDALIRYAIRTYCREPKTIAELKACYDELRAEVGDEAVSKAFDIDFPYLEGYLQSMIALSGGHKRLRYYDILANDYGELLDELDLKSYCNVTLSAQKFFRDYPEVMKQYDIRSGQELHNLLKKLWEYGHYNEYAEEDRRLTFGKMPMLTFGKEDRKKQVFQLLYENNPISYVDFAKLIEKEYGVPQQTATANWVNLVKNYLVNGTYVIPTAEFPADSLCALKEILTEDYYSMADLRHLYTAEYPEGNSRDIGIAAILQLGFIPYGKYVIRNSYKNAMDFFEQLFEKKEILDTRDKPGLTLSSSYHAIRQKLQEEYRIVEVEPGVFYHIRRLQEMGMTKTAISEFCQEIECFVKDDTCFTMRSLKQKGFRIPWDGIFGTEWFCGALLSADTKQFESRRFGKTKLFRRKGKEGKVTLADLLEEITDEFPYMPTIEEIGRILRTTYGIETPPFKIREMLKNDVIFEDRILY